MNTVLKSLKAMMPLSLPKKAEGILLRDVTKADVVPMADIEFDLETKKFMALPNKSREHWLAEFDTDLIHGAAIVALPENVFAGTATIERVRGYATARGELRIVVGRAFRGRHLGRKAAALMIPAAFEEMSAKSLVGVVHPDNEGSLKLLKSWRFRRRDTVKGDSNHWQFGHHVYVLTKGGYERGMPKVIG